MRRIGARPAVWGLTLLAVTVLPGCGRSAPQPPAAAGPAAGTATLDPANAEVTTAPSRARVDPCALVTRPEAEKLAGTPLDDAKPVRETCTYTGPVSGPTAQVEVFVGDGAKKFLDIDRDLGHDLRPLSGVGDEAYAEDGTVFVNKSGLWVSIRLTRLNDPAENRKPLEELARTVAARI
ncbi:hypothetical protein ACNTMW_02125 [Planosporangium sp. 12N6]|uniref:hypothetical protein n=1 Tax=Planosporangium spinosum TaxID=3402278 RepID=UPI003CEAC4C0